MPNDTTKAAPDERAELKPCPFCGDAMEWRAGDYAAHTSQVDNPCPIALHGFTDRAKWNTRTPPQVKPLVWVETRHKSPDQLGCRSSAIGINYVIISALMGGNCILSSGASVYIGPFHFDTIDAAKAAAQADYTRRILDALA